MQTVNREIRGNRATKSATPDGRASARAARALVGFVRGRHDAAGRRRVAQFQLHLLRFFLHSYPPKFTDEMKNLH
jgi:hypothetical protein